MDQDGTCLLVVGSCSLFELESHGWDECPCSTKSHFIPASHLLLPHKTILSQTVFQGCGSKRGLWGLRLEGHTVSPLPPSLSQSKSQGISRFERWRNSLRLMSCIAKKYGCKSGKRCSLFDFAFPSMCKPDANLPLYHLLNSCSSLSKSVRIWAFWWLKWKPWIYSWLFPLHMPHPRY